MCKNRQAKEEQDGPQSFAETGGTGKQGSLSLFLSYRSRQWREELPFEHGTYGSLSISSSAKPSTTAATYLGRARTPLSLSFLQPLQSRMERTASWSWKQEQFSLSSFARLPSAAEPKARTERSRSISLLLSSGESFHIDTDNRQQRLDGRDEWATSERGKVPKISSMSISSVSGIAQGARTGFARESAADSQQKD